MDTAGSGDMPERPWKLTFGDLLNKSWELSEGKGSYPGQIVQLQCKYVQKAGYHHHPFNVS